jgi:hypothetical protein
MVAADEQHDAQHTHAARGVSDKTARYGVHARSVRHEAVQAAVVGFEIECESPPS